MIQTLMFDQQGKPTQIAMRYVLPKYYVVKYTHSSGLANFIHRTTDVHKAIGVWCRNDHTTIQTVW